MSLTAVLLAFLSVSQLLAVVARGRAAAEGNRGRGLTVMWWVVVGGVDLSEGAGAVVVDAEGSDGTTAVGVAAADLGSVGRGGCTSLSWRWRKGTSGDGTVCAASCLDVVGLGLDGRSAEMADKGSGSGASSRGRPSTASATRRKSRRAAKHSFSFFESKAQSPASAGTPRAVQNIVFLHEVGSLVNICIVRSLRENRIRILVDVALAEIATVVARGFVLISISARGSFAMRVHTKVPSYMTT
jgi:hypothetical protein